MNCREGGEKPRYQREKLAGDGRSNDIGAMPVEVAATHSSFIRLSILPGMVVP